MVDAVQDVRAPGAQRRGLVSFSVGFALGLGFYLVVIAGLVYLKLRDTSQEPWETLTLGAFGAAVCISPVQLTVSGVLTSIRRIRWLSMGLLAAGVVGVVVLIVLGLWSSEQADSYARLNHLK
jgi:hypothetical protein